MAENLKRKRSKPWKSIVVNGKRKYIFGEILNKDQSEVRELHGVFSRPQIVPDNLLCTASTSTETADNTTKSECLSQSFLPNDENQMPEVDNDSEPHNTSISPNMEVSSEVAYATELSRLEMVTVVTNCAFVFPDFNVEIR